MAFNGDIDKDHVGFHFAPYLIYGRSIRITAPKKKEVTCHHATS